jgi:hypothetical protein
MIDNRTRSRRHQMELTVGQDAGDLRGTDDKVIQAAADYLHRFGGGVLHILPGEYAMRNALYLHSNLTVRGCGDETILKKAPSVSSMLIQDADWYETQVSVQPGDIAGFRVGDGVLLQSWPNKDEKNPGLHQVERATVLGIEGGALLLNKRHDKNFWLKGQSRVSTLCSVIDGHGVNDIHVKDLVLDGNKAHSDAINGNYAAAMFCQDCDRINVANVTARNYHGDGFSFQRCDDSRFEHCVAEDNQDLGFHPGSGNQRPIYLNCVANRNDQGIFFCWGVTDGLVENCTCCDNRSYGISIGHRDTDNRITGCTIERNAKIGIVQRDDGGPFRAGHRNLIEHSLIADNGSEADGVGIAINAPACDVQIISNRFADTGDRRQRIGVRIGAQAQRTQLAGNRFQGLETDVARK